MTQNQPPQGTVGSSPTAPTNSIRLTMKYIIIFLIVLSVNAVAQDFSNKTLVYPFYPRDAKGEVYKNMTTEELCEHGYTKRVRAVNARLKKEVFKRYGVTRGHFGEYEVDHFISLELGGDNSIENLFPQPYEIYLNVNGKDMKMGAREKDVVETSLHKRICRGELTPKEAQDIITTNWVGYYLRLKHKI